MKTPFFSRNTLYKKPFGCPADNETVTFRLFLPLDCSEAVIALCKDGEMCRYYRFSREFETRVRRRLVELHPRPLFKRALFLLFRI